MKHEWPVLQNKWERLEIIQLREQCASQKEERGNTNGSDFTLYTHSHNKTF